MKQKKKKNTPPHTVQVEITDISNLGYGIARDGGKVLFVQHGVDGDIAQVQVIKECASYDVARITELTKPSRTASRIPVRYHAAAGAAPTSALPASTSLS